MTSHDLPLVTTVAVGLSAAFICGMIATKLRLSPIVGYLLAGVLVGPHTPGFMANQSIADQLSEIGIVLLMFGVGLHFSLKDLMDVKRIAVPGAVAQMIVSIAIGLGLAHLWGWSMTAGFLFGLACSVASTVVMMRAFEDNHLLRTNDGKIAIGWLIVQDLAMVLALVIVPAFAPGEDGAADMSGILTASGIAIGKMVLFAIFMLVVGNRVLPWVLHMVAATGSRELFTLAVFAVAVGVAFGAGQVFGVSLALGAFFSGMMINETHLSHEVAERALPFQDAFAVLFFVSVGMLFNPMVIFEQPIAVILCVLTIMVAKSVASLVTLALFRYPLKTGLLVSAGLGQIGEFSFILAGLGLTLGIFPVEARDIILAGAIISISLNPLTFTGSRIMYSFVERHPKVAALFNMHDDDKLAHMDVQEVAALKNTVILVGAGRVGGYICNNIDTGKNDLVIIDSNRERVEDLREQGFHAIAGDPGARETLQEATIEKAKAIIIVIPDAFEVGRIIDAVREVRPDIKVIVQDRYDSGEVDFLQHEVDLRVHSSEEIGRRMLGYLDTLRG